MSALRIPTSRDIYLEVDGRKIAVVQSYSARTVRETKQIEAFGSESPVAAVAGRTTHLIQLKKVLPVGTGGEAGDFYSLTNFTLMIVKPDRRIIYSGCEWSEIGESADLNQPVVETASITATRRMVMETGG